MSNTSWKYVFSSVTGTSHSNLNIPCQDCCACQIIYSTTGQQILIVVASDGAGSAKYADIASKLTCSLIIEEMRAFFESENNIKKINAELIRDIIKHIQEEIAIRAEDNNSSIREYACTILVAIIGEFSAAFFQLGDGAIVVSSPDEPDIYNWVFWPQKGEYENTTYFITDNCACDNFQVEFTNRRIDKIALFTDGLQSLALHYQTQTVHSPFFRPFFKYLESSEEITIEKLIIPLENFLNSQQVNERTDDDKTLILALRKVEPEG